MSMLNHQLNHMRTLKPRKINIARSMVSVAGALIMLVVLTSGHHYETSLALKHPKLDLHDIWVFESKDLTSTAFILSFNPTTQANGDNFSNNGLYHFHIANDKTLNRGLTLTFAFEGEEVSIYASDKPVTEPGEKGTLIGSGPVNKILKFSNGLKLFTGANQDPFQGNAYGIDGFKQAAEKGEFDMSVFDVGEEGNVFGASNSAIISLEIPNELLPSTIHYYASSDLFIMGRWHQVNTIGHVLFPHMYLMGDEANTKKQSLSPKATFDMRQQVADAFNLFVGLSKMKSDPRKYADSLANIVLPDVVSYEIGTKAHYGLNRRNGRHLRDDAMDVALALMLGADEPVDDQVSIKPERITNEFPYIVPIDDAFLKADQKTLEVEALGALLFDLENRNEPKADPVESGSAVITSYRVYWSVFAVLAVGLLIVFAIRRSKR